MDSCVRPREQLSFESLWAIAMPPAPVVVEVAAPPPKPRRVRTGPDRAHLTASPPPAVPLPVVRGQCVGPGACPKLGCRASTVLHVTGDKAITLQGRHRNNLNAASFDAAVCERVASAAFSCSLDFVEAHPDGADRQAVGEALGYSEALIREIEEGALRRLRESPSGAALIEFWTGQLAAPEFLARVAELEGSADRLETRVASLDPALTEERADARATLSAVERQLWRLGVVHRMPRLRILETPPSGK